MGDVERRLGLSLPDDFKSFTSAYGKQIRVRTWALRAHYEGVDEPLPFALYPDVGGLLPWGGTDNGDVLLWEAKGPPKRWSVWIQHSRFADYDRFEGGMVDFLVRLLTREFVTDVFPDDWPSDAPRFVSNPGIA
jgi:hypothetical protein